MKIIFLNKSMLREKYVLKLELEAKMFELTRAEMQFMSRKKTILKNFRYY